MRQKSSKPLMVAGDWVMWLLMVLLNSLIAARLSEGIDDLAWEERARASARPLGRPSSANVDSSVRGGKMLARER